MKYQRQVVQVSSTLRKPLQQQPRTVIYMDQSMDADILYGDGLKREFMTQFKDQDHAVDQTIN